MRSHETTPDAHGSQPVLFACVGDNALGTIRELLQVADELRVRVSGPFGLAVFDPSRGEVSFSDSLWLSDVDLPLGGSAKSVRSRFDDEGDDTLAAALTRLARRLRPSTGNVAFADARLAGVNCYLLVDLSAAQAPASAIRMARLLRRANLLFDMTALLLTGRTAESQADPAAAWFAAFTEFLTLLAKDNLIQRVYIVDGCDTAKRWLPTLRHMHRVGAEFLLARCASPQWPPTRENPTVDASVIVAGEEVWKVLDPLADSGTTHCVLKAEWLDPQALMMTRIVQGLGNGWQGYPGLPGQSLGASAKIPSENEAYGEDLP